MTDNKTIVAVQLRDRKDSQKFAGREYTYFSTVNLSVGDIIRVPMGTGTKTVRVSQVNVRDSEVEDRILAIMKTIDEVVYPEETCRVCGCTQERACPGGCYWVEPNLCSVCADNKEPLERSD